MPLVAWRPSPHDRPGTGVAPATLRVALAPEARELPRLRAEAIAWLDRHGIDGTTRDDLALALGEAAANAIEHGVPRRPGHPTLGRASIIVEGRIVHPAARRWWPGRPRSTRIELSVWDRGTWTATPAHPATNGALHGGRGLLIMHALTDACRVEHTRRGTRLLLVKHLPGRGPAPRRPVA